MPLAQQRAATLETEPAEDNIDEGLAAITPKVGVAAHAKRGMIEENVFLLPDGAGGPSPFSGGPVEQPPLYRSLDSHHYPQIATEGDDCPSLDDVDEGRGGVGLRGPYGGRKAPTGATATVGAARLLGTSPGPAAQGRGRTGQRKGAAGLSPYEVQPRMDADMAKLMTRKGAKATKSPAPRGRATVASEAPPAGAGLLSQSIHYLNQKLAALQGPEVEEKPARPTRAKLPQESMSKPARDAVVDQQLMNAMMDMVINVDAETFGKLDKLDQDALEAWHNNYKALSKAKGEKRDAAQQKVDL